MIDTILMFIFQVPYKKFDKKNISYIYMCYDIFFAGGEHIFFYICYNLFYAGEEHITYFLQGGIRAHKVSSSKRERMLELDFDDMFVKPYYWSSISCINFLIRLIITLTNSAYHNFN